LKLLKQIFAIAAGVFIAIFLIIYMLIAMASQGFKDNPESDQQNNQAAGNK
jgi:preprotein translocase subunit SecG